MNIISYRKTNGALPIGHAELNGALYHASPRKDLEVLVPMSKTVRDAKEGPVIFATPDISYATTFLIRTEDTWAVGAVIKNVHTMIVSDKERFFGSDKGGAIYELLPKTFTCDLTKSGREKEWVSKIPVYPTKVTHYKSSIDAMLVHFVQLYFVTKNEYQTIISSTDYGYNFLTLCQSYNQQVNKNVRIL